MTELKTDDSYKEAHKENKWLKEKVVLPNPALSTQAFIYYLYTRRIPFLPTFTYSELKDELT